MDSYSKRRKYMFKLTKKKATEFAKALCGSAIGLIQDSDSRWILPAGHMRYDFWILDGRIYCQILVSCHCISSYFFNFDTLEPDFDWTDSRRERDRKEVDKSDKYDFLLWLRDDKHINIPDQLIARYS